MVEHTAVATVEVTLQKQTESLETAGPLQYEWREFFPGRESWMARSTWNAVINTDSSADTAQAAIEQLFFDRVPVPMSFTSASGVVYEGTAIITQFNVQSADQRVIRATIEFKGDGPLTLTPVPT